MECCILKYASVERKCHLSSIYHNKKAFSILEIFVVISILAVITGLAVYSYVDYLEDARKTVRITNLKLINEAISRYYKDNNSYPKYVELKVDSAEKGVLDPYLSLSLSEMVSNIAKTDKESVVKYKVYLPPIKNVTVTDGDVADNNLKKVDILSYEANWITEAEFNASSDVHKNLYMVNEIIATLSLNP